MRSAILARRRKLSPAAVQKASSLIARRVLKLVLPKLVLKSRPLSIALTRSMRDEVQTDELLRAFQAAGHLVLFPRVIPGALLTEPTLEFVRLPVPEPDGFWEPGPYGKIPQPSSVLPHAPPAELDLIFVPGVAFGKKRGERIGMGAGFYDRLLPQAPGATRIALAFDFQVLPELEQKSWDQPVHWIVTDRRVIRVRPPQVRKRRVSRK